MPRFRFNPNQGWIVGIAVSVSTVLIITGFYLFNRTAVPQSQPIHSDVARTWAQIADQIRAPQRISIPTQADRPGEVNHECRNFFQTLMGLDLNQNHENWAELFKTLPESLEECSFNSPTNTELQDLKEFCSKDESMCPLGLLSFRSKLFLNQLGDLHPIESEMNVEILAHRIVAAFSPQSNRMIESEQLREIQSVSKRILELSPDMKEVKKAYLMATLILSTEDENTDWVSMADQIDFLRDLDGKLDEDFKDAWILTKTQGMKLERIEATAEEWMRREPGASGPYELLGYHQYKQGNREKGLQFLRQAIALEKDHGRRQFMQDTLKEAQKPNA